MSLNENLNESISKLDSFTLNERGYLASDDNNDYYKMDASIKEPHNENLNEDEEEEDYIDKALDELIDNYPDDVDSLYCFVREVYMQLQGLEERHPNPKQRCEEMMNAVRAYEEDKDGYRRATDGVRDGGYSINGYYVPRYNDGIWTFHVRKISDDSQRFFEISVDKNGNIVG